MDIPSDFYMPEMLFRQKGSLVLAAPVADAWPEEQPKLFFWKPDQRFHNPWVSDPHFKLTNHRQSAWQEVRNDMQEVIDFVYPKDSVQNLFGPLPIQKEYEEDLRRRQKRIFGSDLR